MDRNEFWQLIEQGYASNYDIANIEPDSTEMPLIAKATMHLSESGYVLSRKAEMWSANSDEHVFFFSADSFTPEDCERCIDFAHREGMDMIDLEADSNHMCTRIVAIFICNNMSEEAASIVKSCKIYKNFKMGLKGWMEVHTVGVDLSSGMVVHNRYGRETAQFYRETLHPETRRRRRSKLDIIKRMFD